MTDAHDIVPAEKLALAERKAEFLHPAVAQILAKNPTVADVKELFAMQMAHEANVARKAFIQAKLALKKALPAWIQHDKKVDFLEVHYTHTSLAGVMEAVQVHLIEFGFELSWKTGVNPKDGKIIVTAVLTHEGGHSEDSFLEAERDMKGSKTNAQGAASSVTLMQRYTALAVLGIVTRDMKGDGEDKGKPIAGRVDAARNMRVMSNLAKFGKTKVDAEQYVGKPLQQWTDPEIEKLRLWVEPAAAPPDAGDDFSGEMEGHEPGADVNEPAPNHLPPPPKNPKEGDSWREVVEVLSVTPKGKFVALSLRHSDRSVTENNCWKDDAADVARSLITTKGTGVATFSVKANAQKKLFVNVEAMEPTPAEDTPF